MRSLSAFISTALIMKIAIRTDASLLTGTGHAARCKTIADELKKRGAEVRFISRDYPEKMTSFLSEAGHEVVYLPAVDSPLMKNPESHYRHWLGVSAEDDASQSIKALGNFKPDWLIVDHYAIDWSWEKQLRAHVGKIIVFDDLANRKHDCDMILDPNGFGIEGEEKYDAFVPPSCQKLLGPRYALLQPIFHKLRSERSAHAGKIKKILIFFGGVDSKNQTIQALKALCDPLFDSFSVNVVIGSGNQHQKEIMELAVKRPDTMIHQRLPTIANVIADSDLMLGAGGSTTWERCCLGVPAIVGVTSENQEKITENLAKKGVHLSLGNASSLQSDDWKSAIREFIEFPERLISFSKNSLGITDGLGALRLAALMDTQPMIITSRTVQASDEALLLEWANDPAVRENSFSPSEINAKAHHEWFGKKMVDPNCIMLLWEDKHGIPIGQVRFDADPQAREAVIDISVDKAFRGRALGEKILRQSIEQYRKKKQVGMLKAEVLFSNRVSSKMFEKVGFQLVNPASAYSHSYSLKIEGFL